MRSVVKKSVERLAAALVAREIEQARCIKRASNWRVTNESVLRSWKKRYGWSDAKLEAFVSWVLAQDWFESVIHFKQSEQYLGTFLAFWERDRKWERDKPKLQAAARAAQSKSGKETVDKDGLTIAEKTALEYIAAGDEWMVSAETKESLIAKGLIDG